MELPNIIDFLRPKEMREEDSVSVKLLDLKTKEGWKLIGPFVSIFVLGLAARIVYKPHWWWPDTIFALSDALIIAGLLGFCLEVYSTKFLIEKVADDLTEKLVGRGLPPELQAHILQITRTDIVRSNYVKRYSLASEPSGKMSLNIGISYEVRNHGDAVTEYSPLLEEEGYYSPVFLYMEYGIQGEMQTFNESAISKLTDTNSETGVKSFKGPKRITLQPIRENHLSVCRVMTNYRVTMPEEYVDITNFGGPLIGVKLHLDELPDGFEFNSQGKGVLHTNGSRSWDYPGPFIRGQHVRVRWSKKHDAQC
ncbi:MAG TPA: hypothetical protein VG322_04695 [Candidatus Acidoferrales bacterium]|nr:hypothetical protein [Candidatus Acidoferrales bacterium]